MIYYEALMGKTFFLKTMTANFTSKNPKTFGIFV